MAITDSNGFRGMAALRRAALDPRIEEIEGGAMDEGRVFLHAAPGWRFREYNTVSKAVGTVSELRAALRSLVSERAS
jgi:hypothetical protein